MVSDDPTAGLVSPNQFGGRPGNLITLLLLGLTLIRGFDNRL